MSSKTDAALDFARLLEEDADGTPELALVGLLRETGAALAPRTTLPDATRAAQRQRLMAVAHVQAVQAETAPAVVETASGGLLAGLRRWSTTLTATRRTVAVAGGMASVVAFLGVGVAASHSLPGDPFYGVKRTTEAAQLKLKGSDESRGEFHLDLARTRLDEVESLSSGDDWALGSVTHGPSGLGAFGSSTEELIRSTLDAMDDQTAQGVEALTSVAQKEKDDAPLRTIAVFAASQGSKLSALLPSLPASAKAQATASLALVEDVRADADQLIRSGFCTDNCNPATAAPTVPTPTITSTPATPTVPPCTCPPASPAAEPSQEPPVSAPSPDPSPTTQSPSPSAPPVVVPTTPPVTTPPLTPPITIPPLITVPTEIPLPSLPITIPGVTLPTSIPLPDLELPTLPGLPPVLGS